MAAIAASSFTRLRPAEGKLGPIVAWVRTADGAGVSGVRVRARLIAPGRDAGNPGEGAKPGHSAELTSDADGRLSWHPTGPVIPLLCELRGVEAEHARIRARVPVVPGIPPEPFILELRKPAWRREVFVTGQGGLPVAGATVQEGGHAVETDHQGRATIDGLDPEARRIQISSPGYLKESVEIDAPRDGTAVAGPFHVTLRSHEFTWTCGFGKEPWLLAGSVVRSDGTSVPGARVWKGPDDEESTPDAVSDASGCFSVQVFGMVGERIPLTIRAAGQVFTEEVVLAESPMRREFRLELGGTIAGTARDAQGAVVAGAVIAAVSAGGRSTATRDDGSFVLETPGPEAVTLRVTAPGFLPETRENVAPGTDSLDVRLMPAGRIAGEVHAEGSAERIPEFTVRLVAAAGPAAATREPALSAPWAFPGKAFRTPDGSFSTDGLPLRPGRHFRVEVRAPGFETAVLPRVAAEARDSGTRVRVALRPGAAVSGTVLRGDTGTPIEGARTAAEGSFGGEGGEPAGASGKTAAAGTFRIDGLPRKTLVVEARKDGFTRARSAPVVLSAPEAVDIGRLLLYPAGSAVVVVEAPRAELGTTRAIASSPPGIAPPFEEEVRVGEDRTVRFEALRAGKVQILLRSTNPALDGLGSVVDIAAGQQATVIFEPPGKSQVSGRVAADTALPDDGGIELRLFAEDAPPDAVPIADARAGADGAFTFRGIEPGRYRLDALLVRAGQRLGGSVVVDLAPGENPVTVRVTLRP